MSAFFDRRGKNPRLLSCNSRNRTAGTDGCCDLTTLVENRGSHTAGPQNCLFIIHGITTLADLRELFLKSRRMRDGMWCETFHGTGIEHLFDLFRRQISSDGLAQRRAINRTPGANLPSQTEAVRTLNHIQVKKLVTVKNPQVRGFAADLPKLLQYRTADLAERFLVIDS